MASRNDDQSTFGVSLFYFFAICVGALILLTVCYAIFGPAAVEASEKMIMTRRLPTRMDWFFTLDRAWSLNFSQLWYFFTW